MPSISITSPLSYIGVLFVIAGAFLVFSGLKIVKIEKITITPGRNTWLFGIFLLALGIIFLLPDINNATQPVSSTPTQTIVAAVLNPTQMAVLQYKVIKDTSIYEQPTTDSRVIENIATGQIVEAINQQGDWVFVTFVVGNVRTTGWIQFENIEVVK